MKRTKILTALLVLYMLWTVYGLGEQAAGLYSGPMMETGSYAVAATVLSLPVYAYLLVKRPRINE